MPRHSIAYREKQTSQISESSDSSKSPNENEPNRIHPASDTDSTSPWMGVPNRSAMIDHGAYNLVTESTAWRNFGKTQIKWEHFSPTHASDKFETRRLRKLENPLLVNPQTTHLLQGKQINIAPFLLLFYISSCLKDFPKMAYRCMQDAKMNKFRVMRVNKNLRTWIFYIICPDAWPGLQERRSTTSILITCADPVLSRVKQVRQRRERSIHRMEKFQNMTPNSSTSRDSTPNSSAFQKLTSDSWILSILPPVW
jgi:hypothetical protein